MRLCMSHFHTLFTGNGKRDAAEAALHTGHLLVGVPHAPAPTQPDSQQHSTPRATSLGDGLRLVALPPPNPRPPPPGSSKPSRLIRPRGAPPRASVLGIPVGSGRRGAQQVERGREGWPGSCPQGSSAGGGPGSQEGGRRGALSPAAQAPPTLLLLRGVPLPSHLWSVPTASCLRRTKVAALHNRWRLCPGAS